MTDLNWSSVCRSRSPSVVGQISFRIHRIHFFGVAVMQTQSCSNCAQVCPVLLDEAQFAVNGRCRDSQLAGNLRGRISLEGKFRNLPQAVSAERIDQLFVQRLNPVFQCCHTWISDVLNSSVATKVFMRHEGGFASDSASTATARPLVTLDIKCPLSQSRIQHSPHIMPTENRDGVSILVEKSGFKRKEEFCKNLLS